MLISCYKKVKFRKAELIMTYMLMSPLERPKGWSFKNYYIYLKYDVDKLWNSPRSSWRLTKDEYAFVNYANGIHNKINENYKEWSGQNFEEFTWLPKTILGVKTHTQNGYYLLGGLGFAAFIVLYCVADTFITNYTELDQALGFKGGEVVPEEAGDESNSTGDGGTEDKNGKAD